MIPKEVIEKAMEGGWRELDRPTSPMPPDLLQRMIDWESTALDPKFWEGLGNAIGETGSELEISKTSRAGIPGGVGMSTGQRAFR